MFAGSLSAPPASRAGEGGGTGADVAAGCALALRTAPVGSSAGSVPGNAMPAGSAGAGNSGTDSGMGGSMADWRPGFAGIGVTGGTTSAGAVGAADSFIDGRAGR